MDPNANLAQQRRLAARIVELRAKHGFTPAADEWIAEAADQLAELVVALDNWISKGGFRPSDWNR